MSDDTLAVVAVVVSAVLALFAFVPLRKGARKAPRGRASPEPTPPQDPAVNVARVLVEEVLAEKVEEVDDASNSASPADELAALGNKRKR